MRQSRRNTLEDPLALLSRAASKFRSIWLAWTYPFASIGQNVWVHHSCELSRSIASYIRLGDGVSLDRDAWLNVPDYCNRDEPVIILEEGCQINRRCMISAINRVHIERNTLFGPSVLVTDHNHAYEDVTIPIDRQGVTRGGTIRIEEGCWIGYGAAVVCSQGELVIGRNCVVGANSVVTRSIPPFSLVTGNPARIVKQYDPSTRKWIRSAENAPLK